MKEAGEQARFTAETMPSPALHRSPEPITVRLRAVRLAVLLVGGADRSLQDALAGAGLRVTAHESLDGASLEQEVVHVIVAVITSPAQLPHLCRLCELGRRPPRLIVLSDCLPPSAPAVLAKVSNDRYRSFPLTASPDTVAIAAREL